MVTVTDPGYPSSGEKLVQVAMHAILKTKQESAGKYASSFFFLKKRLKLYPKKDLFLRRADSSSQNNSRIWALRGLPLAYLDP